MGTVGTDQVSALTELAILVGVATQRTGADINRVGSGPQPMKGINTMHNQLKPGGSAPGERGQRGHLSAEGTCGQKYRRQEELSLESEERK